MADGDWIIELLVALKSEQRDLADLIEEVRRGISGIVRTGHDVENLVARLSTSVESHFAHEERGGYMTEVVDRAPHLAVRIEVLLSQHETLLESIEKVRLLLRSGVESPAWWTRIESDFHKFASRLLNHQHAENLLLQEAFGVDIGTKD